MVPVNGNLPRAAEHVVVPEHKTVVAEDLDESDAQGMHEFGAALRAAIERRGISQREFARLVGLSHSHVNRLVDGRATPPTAPLPTWADLLGLTGHTRDSFISLGISARAQGRIETARYVQRIERNIDRLTDNLTLALTLLRSALDLMRHNGMEVPRSLEKALADLEARLGGLR